jgi:hypothetical protein
MHKVLQLHEKWGIHEYKLRECYMTDNSSRSVSRVNAAVLVLFLNVTTMQLQLRPFSLIFLASLNVHCGLFFFQS